MKKTLLFLCTILVLFPIVSCRSVSGGIGYGGYSSTMTVVNKETGQLMEITEDDEVVFDGTGKYKMISEPNAFSYVADVNSLFGFNKTGPRLFLDSIFRLEQYDKYINFALGPAWEFRLGDRFGIVAGIGASFDLGEKDPDGPLGAENTSYKEAYEDFIKCNLAVCIGIEGFVETRLYFGDDYYLGIKGTAGYCLMNLLEKGKTDGTTVITSMETLPELDVIFSNPLTFSASLVFGKAF